ncbi:gluconate 2-dehydrogenase subunit 3 family protein [Sphingomonas oryzagri]|uniref:Gluconate 2-dehydrogenase subunit 3 family protein n=1 Tax=Sphingomonas oryzagri TaxID=3042314 RepID=A0ABT6N458_9SPHN|nr:gluconate 2-dehydrogenase subunit 3 family protein [Sphingomonas oryzagri]MDH7640025.1 gluconate 2-dehydrogenase subunit 3 family protein [Sphingomonas oryzagri]
MSAPHAAAEPPALVDQPIDRRTLLGTGVLLGGAAYGVRRLAAASAYDDRPLPGAATFIGQISGIVLPRTASMRAGAPADVDFILNALAAGLLGTSAAMLNRVWRLLDERQRVPFLHLDPADQAGALRAFDARVFAPGGPTGTGWPEIKALILAAYYTSEEGASHELRYELVPGRYDPDAPVDPAYRTYSSDWFGSHPVAIEAR